MSCEKDSKTMESSLDLVSDEEMKGFINGLFDKKVPPIDPSWKASFPDLDTIQKETEVELASVTEVRNFISDLFKKP